MTQEPKKIKVQLLGEPKILAAEIMLQMAGEGHVTDQMKLRANDSKEIQVKSGETNIIFELSPPESQMIGGELHTQPKSTADHVIIVLDPTDKNAMDIAEAQIESAKKLFPKASIVLVATKSDEKENWQVTSGQLQTLAQKQKCGFQEASATTGIGCQEIVDVIAKQAATLKVDQNPVTESKILTTPTQGSQHPTPQNIQLSSSKNSDKKELKKKEKQIKKTNKTKTDEVISPKEFAASLRQFSLQYLPDITPAQLKMDPRKKGQRGALDSHIDAQEKLQQFIILDLLRQDNAQDMQRTFDFYLKVLEESIKNNDFQSAATLLGALKSPSILRLRKEEIRLTKVGDRPTVIDAGDNKCIKLNNAQIEFLRDAEMLFDGSNIFENYRKKLDELRSQNKPFVPMTSTIQQVYAQALGGSHTYKEADIDLELSHDKQSARKQIAQARQNTALTTILNDFQPIDKFNSFADARSLDILSRGQDAPPVFKKTHPFHEIAKQPEMASQINSLLQLAQLKTTPKQTVAETTIQPIGNFTIYSDPIEQLMSGWKQSTTEEQQPYTTKEFDDIATALIFRMPAQDIIDSLAAIRARVQSEDGHLYLATPDDQLNFISQTMMLISSIAKIVPDAFAECKFDALTRDKEPEEYARILNKIPDVIKATAHKIQPIEMTVSQTPLIIDAYLNTKVIHKPETARAVAQDLFRNNLKLMTQIQPEEWVNQNWTRGKSPHIMEMANSFNSLNAMVRQDILFAHSEKHQDRIFRFYIEVLDQALANHDYLSAYAIGASLQDSTISRLTYLGDDKRTAEVMEKFKILSNPNENKKAYNTALMSLENTAHVPNIPFLLQIFTFIDDGNKDTVTIGGLDHTNLDKIGLDGREISRFQKQQAMAQAYLAALPTNKPILTTDIPKRITKPYLDTEEAEKQSFAIKPRGTDTSPTFSQERIDLLQRTIPSMVRLKDALAIHINTTVRGCENINQDPLFKEAKSKEKDLEFIHKINSQGEIELSFKSLTLSHLKTLQGSHFAQLLAKDLKNNGYSISDTDIQAGKIILQGTDVVKFLTAAGVTKADIDLAYKGKGFDPSILNKPPMTPSTLAPTVESEADDEEADELFSVKESDLRQTIDVQPVGVTHTIAPEEEQNPSEEEEAKTEAKIEGRPRRGDDVSRQPPRPNADILP
ncbi:MAG: RasGEF domain-containing protein, partial [Candidatus Berkiella sp.]